MSILRRWLGRLLLFLLVALALEVAGAWLTQLAFGRVEPSILATLAGTAAVLAFMVLPWWLGRRIDRGTASPENEATAVVGAIACACIIGLAGLVGLAPSSTRRALAFHADWFLGGPRDAEVLQWGRRAGAWIPRSDDPGEPALGGPVSSVPSSPKAPREVPLDAPEVVESAEPSAPRTPAIHDRPPPADAPPLVSTIFARGAPAVVVLETQAPIEDDENAMFADLYAQLGVQFEEKRGTGFVVDASLIVTALHLIRDAKAIQVTLHDGRVFRDIEVVADDRRHDLALLRIVGSPADLVALPLAEPDSVAIGAPVFAIGNPDHLDYSISTGIVGSVRQLHGTRLIQTQAPVSFGSSGGPVIDEAGRVVGVVTHGKGQGQNLAVALEHLLPMLEAASSARGKRLDHYVPQPRVVTIDDDAGILSSVDKFSHQDFFGLVVRVVDQCLEDLPSSSIDIEIAVGSFPSLPPKVRSELAQRPRSCVESSAPMLWNLLSLTMSQVVKRETATIRLGAEGLRARPNDERPPEARRMTLALVFTPSSNDPMPTVSVNP